METEQATISVNKPDIKEKNLFSQFRVANELTLHLAFLWILKLAVCSYVVVIGKSLHASPFCTVHRRGRQGLSTVLSSRRN